VDEDRRGVGTNIMRIGVHQRSSDTGSTSTDRPDGPGTSVKNATDPAETQT